MKNSIGIIKIYPESFIANVYSKEPFRVIGLIDVSINYVYGNEKVTLPFYRSSGTNSGKIKGLWYPILGIKMYTGRFTEFTEYINYVLTNCTKRGFGIEGWLAKSLFFMGQYENTSKIRGYSDGMYYEALFEIGKMLRYLYEKNLYKEMKSLDAKALNTIVSSKGTYLYNRHTQRENFEKFIADIYDEIK